MVVAVVALTAGLRIREIAQSHHPDGKAVENLLRLVSRVVGTWTIQALCNQLSALCSTLFFLDVLDYTIDKDLSDGRVKVYHNPQTGKAHIYYI